MQTREDPPLSDDDGDPVAPDIRQEVGVDAPEDDLNAFAGKLFEQGVRTVCAAERSMSAIASASMTNHLTG